MSLSTAHLRAALNRPPPPASQIAPKDGVFIRRPAPWYPPPPLPWFATLDPLLKLAFIAAIVAPVVVLLVSF